ncbi:unnamed protein product [Didymodactylos carnosus]|uniref:Uncharacterized protein n=1 Tax=Didymodactylos carnosus TaxID=1234261 RepID=A0A8S2VX12_9BILA|nr:unnamed protein product [Didymodactylos carnosus]CAF4395437.1 unnamed protein product [Didymodactylos carnosus]
MVACLIWTKGKLNEIEAFEGTNQGPLLKPSATLYILTSYDHNTESWDGPQSDELQFNESIKCREIPCKI